MIINNTSTNDVIKIGESNSKQATINQDKIAKLQQMLTSRLYKSPIEACITELSNNMIDSVVQSGKVLNETPSIVKLYKEDNNYFIKFIDKGLGLNKDEFENIVMNYLTSTKENDNNSIGAWGLGAKSWVGLNRPSEWVCRKDNIEYKFLAYKGSEFLEYDLLYERETTEENGVEIKIKIKDWYEYKDFKQAAVKKLSYYDEIVLIIDDIIQENKVYRNDLFQFCDDSPYSSMHISLKDVVYELDYKQLDISEIDIPIALKFNLDSGLLPSISRETLIYNNTVKKIILNRIKEVALYFVTKYNKTTHYNTFLEAYDFINNYTHYVTICGKEFKINGFKKYSNVKCNEITIEGVNNLDISKFKREISNNLDNYYSINCVNDFGVWKKNKLYSYNLLKQFIENKEIIVVNEQITHKLKTFLINKYTNTAYYIFDNNLKRPLKYSTKKVIDNEKSVYIDIENGIFTDTIVYCDLKCFDVLSYYNILTLEKYPKSQWRSVITKYQMLLKQITDNFIVEKNVAESVEFIEWCNNKKEQQRIERNENKKNGTYISKSLNKEKGDITISLFLHNKYKTGLKKEVFTKSINDLRKTNRLTVYFDKKNDIIPDSLYLTYFQTFSKTIDFVLLNTTEIKHVEYLYQFITFKQFKMSKPFARLATAILAENILNNTPNEDLQLINECFPKYEALNKQINDYVDKNKQSGNNKTFNIILEEAKENNNWDQNIYPELIEYKQIISKFGFLNYMQNKDSCRMSKEEKAVIKNIVYIMYKHNKINHEFVENMVLVPKSSICVDGVNTENEVQITSSLAEQLLEI